MALLPRENTYVAGKMMLEAGWLGAQKGLLVGDLSSPPSGSLSGGCLGFPITWWLGSKMEEVLLPGLFSAQVQRS